MTLHPLIRALRRHKAGVLLIVLQIALTLAIVCNAVFIIAQRIERLNRPTGVQEAGLIRISQSWLDAPRAMTWTSVEQLDALQRADLATLRQVPGRDRCGRQRQHAAAGRDLERRPAHATPDQKNATTPGRALLRRRAHAAHAGPAVWSAGRNFTAAGNRHHTIRSTAGRTGERSSPRRWPTAVSAGDALGKTIYVGARPSTIVGIVERLQTPTVAEWGSGWAYNAVLLPVRLDGSTASYALRATPRSTSRR